MKKIIMMMALFFAIGAGAAQAQDKPKKETFSWQKAYMDEAGIPADVQTKIDDIKKEFEGKAKTIRKDATLDEDAKKEKLKENNKQKAQAIEALLTKEQKARIRDIRERIKKANEASEEK